MAPESGKVATSTDGVIVWKSSGKYMMSSREEWWQAQKW
jgi:hypothetical protein